MSRNLSIMGLLCSKLERCISLETTSMTMVFCRPAFSALDYSVTTFICLLRHMKYKTIAYHSCVATYALCPKHGRTWGELPNTFNAEPSRAILQCGSTLSKSYKSTLPNIEKFYITDKMTHLGCSNSV